MSQAAALTGVSERQIQHWMDQGYITPSAQGTRKINGDSLDKIILIRQARASGIPLRRAVAMARDYLNEEASGRIEAEIAPPLLSDLSEKLGSLRSGIENVEDLIHQIERQDKRVRAL
jgi:DNA-binding transcriptional MerR regulator